jgi:hypothetical protein
MSKKNKKCKCDKKCKKSDDIVAVQGFEIEVGLANELTDDAVFILGHVKRNGAATFETDDGPEDAKTVQYLRKVAEEGYFSMFSEHNDHVHAIVDTGKQFRVELSH